MAHADHSAVAQSSSCKLWQVYQDALENNAQLAAAYADRAARAEGVAQARAGFLPTLTGNIESTQRTVDTRTREQVSGNSSQLVLTQPLLHVDRWFALGAAKAEDRKAELELALAGEKLMLDSAVAYFGVLKAKDALAASKAESAALSLQLLRAQKRLSLGLADRVDELQALAERDIAQANRIIAQKQLDNAIQALETLTQRRYSSFEGVSQQMPVRYPIPEDARHWVETALERNLQLLASQQAIDATEQTLKARKAGHLPSLDMVLRQQVADNDLSGYGSRYRGSVEQSYIGLQLSVPLFSGGQLSSQVREAQWRFSQKESLGRDLRYRVEEQTRTLHSSLSSTVEQIHARRQAVMSSQGALLATQTGLRAGTRNIVDVLQVQRQLYGSIRDYNDSRYEYLLGSLRLSQTTGGLSEQKLMSYCDYLQAGYDAERDFFPAELSQQL